MKFRPNFYIHNLISNTQKTRTEMSGHAGNTHMVVIHPIEAHMVTDSTCYVSNDRCHVDSHFTSTAALIGMNVLNTVKFADNAKPGHHKLECWQHLQRMNQTVNTSYCTKILS
jgi:predicted transglutaminase-like cysteine proteinase